MNITQSTSSGNIRSDNPPLDPAQQLVYDVAMKKLRWEMLLYRSAASVKELEREHWKNEVALHWLPFKTWFSGFSMRIWRNDQELTEMLGNVANYRTQMRKLLDMENQLIEGERAAATCVKENMTEGIQTLDQAIRELERTDTLDAKAELRVAQALRQNLVQLRSIRVH